MSPANHAYIEILVLHVDLLIVATPNKSLSSMDRIMSPRLKDGQPLGKKILLPSSIQKLCICAECFPETSIDLMTGFPVQGKYIGAKEHGTQSVGWLQQKLHPLKSHMYYIQSH